MPRGVVVSSSSSSSSIAAMKGSIGAVVGCDRVFCGVVRDAVGFNFFFRSSNPIRESRCKNRLFQRVARVGLLYRKNWDRRNHFFDCVRMPDLVCDRKSPFSIHRSNCIRISLIRNRPSHCFNIKIESGPVGHPLEPRTFRIGLSL